MQTTRYQDAQELMGACRTDQATRWEITEKLAVRFVLVAREDLEEGDLVGVDYANTYNGSAGTCATHDYMDANMTMAEAFERVVAEEVTDAKVAPTITDLVTGHGYAAQAARDIWNRAWDVAQNRGFSSLWRRRSEVEDGDFKTLASVVLQRPEGHSDDRRFPHLPDWVDIEDDIFDVSFELLKNLDDVADLEPIATAVSEAFNAKDENILLEALAEAIPKPSP